MYASDSSEMLLFSFFTSVRARKRPSSSSRRRRQYATAGIFLDLTRFLFQTVFWPGSRICIQIIATLCAKQYEEYSNRRPPSLVYATSTVRAQFWNATTTDGILRGRFRNSKVVRLKFLQFYLACAIDYAVVPGQIFEIIYAV